MAEPNEQFPYRGSFDEMKRTFDLVRTNLSPVRVALSKWVRNSNGILQGQLSTLCGVNEEACLVVDFGQEIVGSISFRVKSASKTELRIYYGESFKEAMRDEPYPLSWYKLPLDKFELNPGEQVLQNPGRRGFRFVRFVTSGEVQISDLVAELRHYPVEEKGSFSCADPLINRIWDLSLNTTKLCMQQYYEDGLKRDGMLWIGDFRVQFLCNLFAFGDVDLARKSLYMIASTQRIDGVLPACASTAGGHQHPHNINYMPNDWENWVWVLINYCCDFVSLLREYAFYTGDQKALQELWPFAARTLRFLAQDLNPGDINSEFTYITDNQEDTEEIWWQSKGTLLMQLIWAMADGKYLAGQMNDAATESLAYEAEARFKAKVQSEYFDSKLDLYIDDSTSTSLHVNTYSTLAGIHQNAEGKDLIARVLAYKEARRPCCGMSEFWTQEALFRSGFTQEALKEMRRYYGYMLNEGATTTWERLYSTGTEKRGQEHPTSRCHGWSAGPAFHLPAHILGISPSGQGWKQLIIKPSLGDLEWAEGSVTIPECGNLFIHWEAGEQIRGYMEIPEGVTVDVVLDKIITLSPGKHTVNGK